VRSFNDEGDIDTIGEFCAYRNKREAIAAIPKD
jgi:ethanolamine utilization protein EutP (predicted NTPase)